MGRSRFMEQFTGKFNQQIDELGIATQTIPLSDRRASVFLHQRQLRKRSNRFDSQFNTRNVKRNIFVCAHTWFWCFVRCKTVSFIFKNELNNVKGHLAHTKDRTTRNIAQLSRFETIALRHSPYLFARHIGWSHQFDGLSSLVANEMPESWDCTKSPQNLNSASANVALATHTHTRLQANEIRLRIFFQSVCYCYHPIIGCLPLLLFLLL